MTREEAAWVLTELADEYEKYELSKNGWLGTTYIPAHRMGVAALRGPQPDPITGLVPCGCGGKAAPMKFNDGFADFERVWCVECKIEVTRVENGAKEAWNRAMGWKGGAE